MMVAGIRMLVMCPGRGKADSQPELIRRTLGRQIPKHGRQAIRKREGVRPAGPRPRKAWTKAPNMNTSRHLASNSRSSSFPSSMIQRSGSNMLSNAPMGVGYLGAARGKQ